MLFLSFLKLGMTAFGGPAMVAYIGKMAVERNKWLDDVTFHDGVALCQTIPGATAMQTAAYVGLRVRGVPGAAASFIGFGLPAFCFMAILSYLYANTHDLPLVLAAFSGLRAMIVAIVANATFSFGKGTMKGPADIAIAVVAAALFAIKVNPVLVILLAACLGLVFYWRIQSEREKSAVLAARVSYRRPFALILLAAVAALAVLFAADRRLFDLAGLMLRIDLFAFGGGFASVPLMYHEIVDVRSWMDRTTFMDGIALGQVTPGPIVITATFVGYWLQGIPGTIVATASIFLPSFLMVVGIVPYYDRLRANAYFNRCISGILSSFVGLLLSVTIQFSLDVPWDASRVILASAALAALLFKVEILWVVLVGIAVSMILF
jgi:chromate transporter